MTKIDKLCEAYEDFGQAISTVPNDKLKDLSDICVGVREFVLETRRQNPKITLSQVATGLEQGWREMPIVIQGFAPEWRQIVCKIWHDATSHAYPEFLAMQEQRLQIVLGRGKIRTENEYYRIRHQVDVLEGKAESQVELQRLYSLIDDYESR